MAKNLKTFFNRFSFEIRLYHIFHRKIEKFHIVFPNFDFWPSILNILCQAVFDRFSLCSPTTALTDRTPHDSRTVYGAVAGRKSLAIWVSKFRSKVYKIGYRGSPVNTISISAVPRLVQFFRILICQTNENWKKFLISIR